MPGRGTGQGYFRGGVDSVEGEGGKERFVGAAGTGDDVGGGCSVVVKVEVEVVASSAATQTIVGTAQ